MMEKPRKIELAATAVQAGAAMLEPGSRHPRPFPPPWASSWGDDRHGLWAQFELPFEKHSVQQRMRWIEPGEFLMGAAESEKEGDEIEHPQHPVVISRGFWLADTACSQALWQALMHENPGHFNASRGGGPEHPLECVNWRMIQTFLQLLQHGMPALHPTLTACATLPTEAEWEYACRAGSHTRFSFGENMTPDQVNFAGNFPGANQASNAPGRPARQGTVPVKALPANDWGLYQMHGNVAEWCADGLRRYSQTGAIDPGLEQALARAADGDPVLRGGSWCDAQQVVRAACRRSLTPDGKNYDVGFRFVLRVDSTGVPQDFLNPQERAQTEGRGDPFADWKE